jgi:hypothetical protein
MAMAEKAPIQVIKAVCETEAKAAESAIKKQDKEFSKLEENISKLFGQTLAKASGLSGHEKKDIQEIVPEIKPKPAVAEEKAPTPEPE